MLFPFRVDGPGGDARCVICDAALPASPTPRLLLCHRAVCIGRHAMLRPHEQCATCQRPLTWQQQVAGICDRGPCQQSRFEQRRITEGAAAEQLRRTAARMRNRSLASRSVPKQEWETWPVTVVPKFRARASRLPAARRKAFVAHLRRLLERARLRPGECFTAEDSAAVANADTPRREEIEALLGATCGACRGACCGRAGNHAFLTEDSMLRYLHRTPDVTNDQVLSAYLAFVPTRTLTGGCVFQRADGCALPRDMRSETCNRFLCPGLRTLNTTLREAAPIRTYVAHCEDGTITSGRLLPVLAS